MSFLLRELVEDRSEGVWPRLGEDMTTLALASDGLKGGCCMFTMRCEGTDRGDGSRQLAGSGSRELTELDDCG